MGNLFIRKVSYSGDKYYYQSPDFDNGINIIVGENGNGKSTFISFIYYCLGGVVKQFEKEGKEINKLISSDTNNYVELIVQINQDTFIIRRTIGTNFITIADKKGKVESYSINRRENPVIFSDWLLSKLGITLIDIFQGDKKFKLNVQDIFRLIYHDQNPDPKKIYKSTDSDSFVSDSEYVRKLIFRILLGKSFEKYYSELGEYINAEIEKNIASSILKEFKQISSQLYKNDDEITNIDHLKENIFESQEQLSKLEKSRALLKIQRPNRSDSAWTNVERVKREILTNELQRQNIQEEINNASQELFKYEKYKEGVIKEVTQLNKIIHTHNTLEVFAATSCPFCLNNLERENGKCYCGNSVDEETFEKFFFNTEEYWDLLKSRKKSVETVDLVIKSVKDQLDDLVAKLQKLDLVNDELRNELKRNLSDIDQESIDIDRVNELDDKTLIIKSELQNLLKKLEFEEQLDVYQKKFDSKEAEYKRLKRDVQILELSANKEMETVVNDFNAIFDPLMVKTLKDCRTAKIDPENYEPIIDGGVYREASAKVSVRFNYYLTLLLLSLKYKNLKFPKFLLIDTPNTAGIDPEQLKKLYSQLSNIEGDNFQIILTTGYDTYPDELASKVREELTDDDKLLKSRGDLSI